jgi:hypothetical protein
MESRSPAADRRPRASRSRSSVAALAFDRSDHRTHQDIQLSQLESIERSPLLLEISRPGIFCVGDVRSRSIKTCGDSHWRGLNGGSSRVQSPPGYCCRQRGTTTDQLGTPGEGYAFPPGPATSSIERWNRSSTCAISPCSPPRRARRPASPRGWSNRIPMGRTFAPLAFRERGDRAEAHAKATRAHCCDRSQRQANSSCIQPVRRGSIPEP